MLIETYLPGPEFTVAVLGNGDEARCLPIVGMRFDTLPKGAPPIYGYEAKWLWDSPSHPLEIFECPAQIPEGLAEDIRAAALGAYHALECRDWCRVDIRCDATNRPMVVELNPLPGILPDPRDNSCFPKAARAAGISYDDLDPHRRRHRVAPDQRPITPGGGSLNACGDLVRCWKRRVEPPGRGRGRGQRPRDPGCSPAPGP